MDLIRKFMFLSAYLLILIIVFAALTPLHHKQLHKNNKNRISHLMRIFFCVVERYASIAMRKKNESEIYKQKQMENSDFD